LVLVLALTGCGAELDDKQPYSVLQSEEYRLRQSGERYRYVFKRRALGSEYDTLALPSRNHSGQYVVMIANAAGPDNVLMVPSDERARPLITPATLSELASRGLLSDASKAYLVHRMTEQ
jgi:hypothetical protein